MALDGDLLVKSTNVFLPAVLLSAAVASGSCTGPEVPDCDQSEQPRRESPPRDELFSHARHASIVGGCRLCHQPAGKLGTMEFGRYYYVGGRECASCHGIAGLVEADEDETWWTRARRDAELYPNAVRFNERPRARGLASFHHRRHARAAARALVDGEVRESLDSCVACHEDVTRTGLGASGRRNAPSMNGCDRCHDRIEDCDGCHVRTDDDDGLEEARVTALVHAMTDELDVSKLPRSHCELYWRWKRGQKEAE